MMFRIVGVLLAVTATAPVAAQQVELLNFDEPNDKFVLDVGPTAVMKAAMARPTPLEDTLAAEFEQFAASPTTSFDEPVPAMASLAVPLWMQTGLVSGSRSTAVLSAYRPSTEPCTTDGYRPRLDLGFATEQRRAALYPLIALIACEHGLPVGLFDALVAQESRYRRDVLSPKGAIGLTQLMPGTAQYLGVSDPWDAIQNLRGGARYLREQLDEFGRVDLALAAYNAGPGRVRVRRRIPQIRETIRYVSSITAAWTRATNRRIELVGANASASARSPFRSAAVLTYTSASTSNPM